MSDFDREMNPAELKERLRRSAKALAYVLAFLKRDYANDVPGIRSLVERT